MRPEAAALPLDEYIQSPMHGPTPCIHIQSQAPLQRQTPYRCKLVNSAPQDTSPKTHDPRLTTKDSRPKTHDPSPTPSPTPPLPVPRPPFLNPLFHHLQCTRGEAPTRLPGGFPILAVCPAPCRQRQFARLFRAQPQPATLSELISHAAVHPTTPEFYAQSHRLIAVLRERLPFEKITTAVANGASVDELAQRSGYADTLRLQRRYLRVLSEMPN